MTTTASSFTPTKDAERHAAVAARLGVGGTVDVVAGVTPTHRGKVRDVFVHGDELLLVATDRVSAFDVVLGTIPLKGQLLTEQSAFWLEAARAVVNTHLIERVAPEVMRCKKAQPFPVELVVRGYLAGSLMREPKESRGHAYGLSLDPNLANYAPFESPIITPTTKEAVGVHDQPCSQKDLVATGRITQAQLDVVVEAARALFALGQAHAERQGLILVDTKYEFGVVDGKVCLIDEIHTADSSRFWVRASYESRVAAGEAPVMLDKENLRRWLLAQGFSGHGAPPALSDEIRAELALHYWNLTEQVLGRRFEPQPSGPDGLAAVVRRFVAT